MNKKYILFIAALFITYCTKYNAIQGMHTEKYDNPYPSKIREEDFESFEYIPQFTSKQPNAPEPEYNSGQNSSEQSDRFYAERHASRQQEHAGPLFKQKINQEVNVQQEIKNYHNCDFSKDEIKISIERKSKIIEKKGKKNKKNGARKKIAQKNKKKYYPHTNSDFSESESSYSSSESEISTKKNSAILNKKKNYTYKKPNLKEPTKSEIEEALLLYGYNSYHDYENYINEYLASADSFKTNLKRPFKKIVPKWNNYETNSEFIELTRNFCTGEYTYGNNFILQKLLLELSMLYYILKNTYTADSKILAKSLRKNILLALAFFVKSDPLGESHKNIHYCLHFMNRAQEILNANSDLTYEKTLKKLKIIQQITIYSTKLDTIIKNMCKSITLCRETPNREIIDLLKKEYSNICRTNLDETFCCIKYKKFMIDFPTEKTLEFNIGPIFPSNIEYYATINFIKDKSRTNLATNSQHYKELNQIITKIKSVYKDKLENEQREEEKRALKKKCCYCILGTIFFPVLVIYEAIRLASDEN